MNNNKKWSLLFIKDENSKFDLQTKAFNALFSKVDMVLGRQEALHLFDKNDYDIVIGDISIKPEELAFLKQIKDKKFEQTIFALVAPKDTDKLYGIADLGLHAIELTPTQFEEALEMIAQFNPYEENKN